MQFYIKLNTHTINLTNTYLEKEDFVKITVKYKKYTGRVLD